MIEFQKATTATKSFGRGNDNSYTPPIYKIIKNGKHIGYIHGTSARYMEKSQWYIEEIGEWNIGRHSFNSLKEAKEYIIKQLQ